jgi:NADH dehydrogenase
MSGHGAGGRHRVVVVGGGFGGLHVVRALERAPVELTLVDRHNYHLFQPLSYQVATGALSPGDIAVPLRHVVRGREHVRVVLGEVTGFDPARRRVLLEPAVAGPTPAPLEYDTLVVAGGSSYSYFGHEDWRELALEVKSLDSALEVRGRILAAFEAAELEPDPVAREPWLTFVVVGAGPTGVEMAGQIAELARDTLPTEFRHSDPRAARVLLVETVDRVLSTFSPRLSERARRSLERLGVTPMLGRTVTAIEPGAVHLRGPDGSLRRVATRTVVWAAGVTASPLARTLAEATGAEVDRAGRVAVEPDLTLPGHPEILALGDMVRVRPARGAEPEALPGVAPVAIQQGDHAGRLIAARLAGEALGPFRYRDRGTMATIGRRHAVAALPRIELSGTSAWLAWLLVHIVNLIGFENRLVVLLRWASSFLTRGRGNRLITEARDPRR